MKKTILVTGIMATVGLVSTYGIGIASAAEEPRTAEEMKKAAQSAISPKDSGITPVGPDGKTIDDVIVEDRPSGKTNVSEGDSPSQQFNTFVSQNKITQTQADQLKVKLDEVLDFKRSILPNMTEQERDALVQARVDAFTQWAATQHIPAEVLPTLIVHNGSDGQRHGLEIGFKN